ncbi:MAG TPA: TIGR03086 family metal-binding protein [Acidimicrobiia bacterium]|nr:TIGR03086 family metal-binding protein [Acidimicrobiia bacterium]
MTELIVLFERAVDGFGRLVHATGAEQWHDPTPDTEWDVRMLVNHVTVEQLWVPPLAQGASVADIGDRFDGDQLGDDPVATWDEAVRASLAAFGAPGALDGTVSLSSGERPTAEYCWEMTTDALIHSWDLARGIGADDTLDPELSDLVYERTLPFAEQLQETGMFAPPVPVPADAPLQTRLLAIFGRSA